MRRVSILERVPSAFHTFLVHIDVLPPKPSYCRLIRKYCGSLYHISDKYAEVVGNFHGIG